MKGLTQMADSKPMQVSNIASLFEGRRKTETRLCEAHGEYESACFVLGGEPRWSACPACDQERMQIDNRELSRRLTREIEEAKQREMLGRAAIPKRFSARTLDNYVAEIEGQQKALNSARRYVECWEENRARGTSLIYCGNPGTGKTHLAIGIAKELMQQGHTALFARVIEMAAAVKETYTKGSAQTERQVLRSFARPDLLILDEVGQQHGSDTERMILSEVINARYEDCKPTILISNLSLTGLREYLDPRAEDRLREGGGRVVVFDWASKRGEL
jgi:DNA replication protein DnaC